MRFLSLIVLEKKCRHSWPNSASFRQYWQVWSFRQLSPFQHLFLQSGSSYCSFYHSPFWKRSVGKAHQIVYLSGSIASFETAGSSLLFNKYFFNPAARTALESIWLTQSIFFLSGRLLLILRLPIWDSYHSSFSKRSVGTGHQEMHLSGSIVSFETAGKSLFFNKYFFNPAALTTVESIWLTQSIFFLSGGLLLILGFHIWESYHSSFSKRNVGTGHQILHLLGSIDSFETAGSCLIFNKYFFNPAASFTLGSIWLPQSIFFLSGRLLLI